MKLASLRHDLLLRSVNEQGHLTVDAAMDLCQASPATIRRDFDRLARAGAVERVRGAIRSKAGQSNLPFAVRSERQIGEKQRIADCAAQLLKPRDVVFIDGGTTTHQLAAFLPAISLRIITNSLSLVASLENRSPQRAHWEIFLTGGCLIPGSGLLVGPTAQHGLAQYHADWAMLSAGGINESGVFNDNEQVVESEKVMIERAERVAVLADHTKWGRHAMCHIASLHDIDVWVTDQSPDLMGASASTDAAAIDVRVA